MGGFAIDYEHDSEEVVALKKHIANQGMYFLFVILSALTQTKLRQQMCGTGGSAAEMRTQAAGLEGDAG